MGDYLLGLCYLIAGEELIGRLDEGKMAKYIPADPEFRIDLHVALEEQWNHLHKVAYPEYARRLNEFNVRGIERV